MSVAHVDYIFVIQYCQSVNFLEYWSLLLFCNCGKNFGLKKIKVKQRGDLMISPKQMSRLTQIQETEEGSKKADDIPDNVDHGEVVRPGQFDG